MTQNTVKIKSGYILTHKGSGVPSSIVLTLRLKIRNV